MIVTLHPQLAADFHHLHAIDGCHVLLRRNALIPWYIIVPETEVSELDRLPDKQRQQVHALSDRVARFIRREHGSQRVNVAAIGNLVPQLHLHVIGRSPDDPCWPGVVWGQLPEGPDWSEADVTHLENKLVAALNETGA